MLVTIQFTTYIYEDSTCRTFGSSASLRLGDSWVVTANRIPEGSYSAIRNPHSAISVTNTYVADGQRPRNDTSSGSTSYWWALY